MKKVLVLIIVSVLLVMSFAAFRDIPKGHWAEIYVNKLAETGIITGFPDGTFRGDESVTRYQISLFLYRVLDYVSSQIESSATSLSQRIESVSSESSSTLTALKNDNEENKKNIEILLNKVELLEEYANMIYDTLGTKASVDEMDALNEKLAKIEEIVNELQPVVDDLKVAVDIHDSDILKMYDALGMLSDEVAMLQEALAGYVDKETYETLADRLELLEEYTNSIYETLGTKISTEELENTLAELDERIFTIETDLLNVKSTVETGLPALRDMLYELSSNLASTEERISSFVEVSIAAAKEEVKEEIMNDVQPALDDMKVTLDIHDSDILKIYDTLGTLSGDVAALQERLSGYEELLNTLEAISHKVDIHDQDILNIYDNLSTKVDRTDVEMLEASLTTLEKNVNGLSGNLSGLAAQIRDTDYLLRKQIADTKKELQENIDKKADKEAVAEIKEVKADKAEVEGVKEELSKKVDGVQNDTKRVEQIATWGVITGLAGTIIGIIALGKVFRWF